MNVLTSVFISRGPLSAGLRVTGMVGGVAGIALSSMSSGGGGAMLAAVISSSVVLSMWIIDRLVNRHRKVSDLIVRQQELIAHEWETQRRNWQDDLGRATTVISNLREQLASAEEGLQKARGEIDRIEVRKRSYEALVDPGTTSTPASLPPPGPSPT